MNFNLGVKEKARYLSTLPAIRERCQRVFDLAEQGKLQYFDLDLSKLADVEAFCIDIIQVRSFICSID